MKFKFLLLLVVFSFAGCATVSAEQSATKVSDPSGRKFKRTEWLE